MRQGKGRSQKRNLVLKKSFEEGTIPGVKKEVWESLGTLKGEKSRSVLWGEKRPSG